jgi:toxin-antitoxin system PIN domain toxin
MRWLADINVVFPLLVEAHTHHRTAWKWWEGAEEESIAWCLPVRLGVLRLLTNRAAMAGDPVSPEEALAAWGEFAHDERVFEAVTPGMHIDLFFRKNVTGRQSSPNLWTDAWLAACAQSLGIGLVSFDTDFKAFELIKFLHLRLRG